MQTKKGKVFVVTNQKGGVGKTTVTRNVAACLYGRGYSVMMIDFDTQGSLSFSCGVKNFKNLPMEKTIAYPFVQVLNNKEGGTFPNIRLKSDPGRTLDLLPANKTLYQVQEILGSFNENVRFIALKLIVGLLKPYYDYIFIDTPPTISPILQNAIVAADECLLVSTPESLSMDGIIESYESIQNMAQRTNSNIGIAGVIINDHTSNRAHQDHVIGQIATICEERNIHVFKTRIPRAASIEEAMSAGQSATEYKWISDKALDAFVQITDEFLREEKKKEENTKKVSEVE